MLTGFLDDRSTASWGEYLKGALDLIISVVTAFILYFSIKQISPDGIVHFWLPFFANEVAVNPVVYIVICTIMLWASINTTNCTDGVDGLSSCSAYSRYSFLLYSWPQGHCSLSFDSAFTCRCKLGCFAYDHGWCCNGLSLAQCIPKSLSYGRCRKPCTRLLYWRWRNDKRKPIYHSCNFFNHFDKRRNGTSQSFPSPLL